MNGPPWYLWLVPLSLMVTAFIIWLVATVRSW